MFPQLSKSIQNIMVDLSTGLAKILDERLVGVYLAGSAASGDFVEATSDLDFLVVTSGLLSVEDGLAIGLLHRDLLAIHPLARRLEGDYAPQELLTVEGTSAPVPGCEQGVYLPRVGEVMLSADNLYDVRINGLRFFGPPPGEVLPAVSSEHVRAAVRTMLAEGLAPCPTAAEAASELLNLVRSLAALATGVPETKSAGARWALDHLELRWHPVIHAALAVRIGKASADEERILWRDLRLIDRALRPTTG